MDFLSEAGVHSTETQMSIKDRNRIFRNTHVFILRVWTELSEAQDTPDSYRISIDHVNTKKHYALNDIKQLPAFILSFFKVKHKKSGT